MIKYRKICEAVVEQVMMLPEGSIVVTGGADGVDSVAAFQACQRGLKVIEYLPDYKKYGSKMAPLVRNILIIEGCDELIAFPASWSTGTWHGIQIAREKEKPLCVKKL
jgi:predicted Rossmann fold nucleotide-binding protein DprA/Smf involved in DNA uptake